MSQAFPITQTALPGVITSMVSFNWVPIIQGAPGVGKTQIIRQWAKKHGYSLLVELLGTSDPMMFRGLQGIDSSGDEPTTVDCVPAIIKKVRDLRDKTGKPVLLFLDEITLAPPSMQGAALTFIQDREINGISLPEDTRIVAAGNSVSDSSAVFELTGPAQNRVVHYYLQPQFEDWKTYMFEIGGHPLLIGALESHDDSFYTEDAADATGPFPSPRQWERVSDYMKDIDEKGKDYEGSITMATIYGLVGAHHGGAVMSTIKLADGIPTPQEILARPGGAVVPSEDDRKRLYLAMSVCQSLLARASDSERKSVSAAVFKYMERLPEAFMLAFILYVCKTDVVKWALGMQPKYVGKYSSHLGAFSKDD